MMMFCCVIGAGVSLSSSLTNRASSSMVLSTLDGIAEMRSERREISIIPRFAASLMLKPRMIATIDLPPRFDSTYFSENE